MTKNKQGAREIGGAREAGRRVRSERECSDVGESNDSPALPTSRAPCESSWSGYLAAWVGEPASGVAEGGGWRRSWGDLGRSAARPVAISAVRRGPSEQP